MATGGCSRGRSKRGTETPSDLSLFKAQNGLDKGVHFKPWDEKWKTQCRSRIKGCDGMIALVSKNTKNASGALWEVKTSKEEKVPVRGIYTTADERPTTLPAEFSGVTVVSWTWLNIKAFLNSL